jgi:hypothetical protein
MFVSSGILHSLPAFIKGRILMRTVSFSIGAALAVAVCSAALVAQAPALNVKLGLWETTVTTKIGGDVPGMDMSKLTPEQQAQMQQAMKQFMGSHTVTNKTCLTKDQLDKANFLGKDEPNCKTTISKNTSTVMEGHQVCTGDDARTVDLHFEAASPTSVNGTFKSTATSQGKTMNVDGTITGRWLGADCGNIK